MKKIILFVFVALSQCLLSQNERKVLFIGIDGVRSDALQQANTPHLDSLFTTGISTYDSWNLGITVSGPAWSSMLTGVWEPKHRVLGNTYAGNQFMTYPYFPNYLKRIDPTIKCVQIITWNPMDDADKGTGGNVINAMWDLSIDAGDYGQGLVSASAILQLEDPDLDVLFIHFDEPDATGHGSGFSPANPQYINSIEGADYEIGLVIDALKARPSYANEDWIIMGTTDHGGTGNGHGGFSDDERHIWWYLSGAQIPNQVLTGADPGSLFINNNPVDSTILEVTPVQTDICVTLIDWILPNVDPENMLGWYLDGKSWIPDTLGITDPAMQIFEDTTVSGIKVLVENLSVQIYPNPVNDFFKVETSRPIKDAVIALYSIDGYKLIQFENEGKRSTFFMDIRELAHGPLILIMFDEDKMQVFQSIVLKK